MIFILLFTIAGCSQFEDGVHIYNDSSTESEKAEKIFENDDRLVSANVIFYDKKIVSGVTVKTFSRFHKKKIEKDLKKKLESAYPEYEITVSADNKIVHMTAKLIQNKDNNHVEKELKKIISLLKEET